MAATLTLAANHLRARRRAGLVATIAIVALASVGIVTGLLVADAGARTLDGLAAQANVAQIVAYANPATATRLTGDADLAAVSGPFPIAEGDLAHGTDSVPVHLAGMDATPPAVSRPLVRAGRWLVASDRTAVVVERSLAQDLDLHLNDHLAVRVGGHDVNLTVVGTALDFTDCLYPGCDPGRLFAPRALVEQLAAAGDHTVQVLARVNEHVDPEAVVARWFQQYGSGISGTDTWQDNTRNDFLAADRIFGGFLTAFGGFVLVAAAVVVAGATIARTAARRRELAVTKTLGATPRQLGASIMIEQLVLAGVGVAIGWLVGSVLAPYTVVGLARTLGHGGPQFRVATLVVTAVVVGVVVGAATVLPAWRLGRAAPVDGLRDLTPTPRLRSRHLTERPILGVTASDVLARPVRSLLVALALVVAIAGAVIGVGFQHTMSGAARHPERSSAAWDASVEPTGADAASTERVLSSTPQVGGWFSQLDRRALVGDTAFLSRAIGGPVDERLFPLGGGQPLRHTGDAIVGYSLQRTLHVHPGDDVTLTAGGTPLTVHVVGWFRTTEDSGDVLVYRLEQLTHADPTATPDSWNARSAPGTSATQLAAALQQALPGASVRVRTTSSGLGAFQAALAVIVALVAAVALAHLFSMAITSRRETSRQLGIQRALGYTDSQLTAQHALAATVLGAAAVVVALPLGLVAFHELSDAVTAPIGLGPQFATNPTGGQLAAIAAVALAATALVGVGTARVMLRRPTTALLRSE